MNKALKILDSATKTLESEIRVWTKLNELGIAKKCKKELKEVKEAIEILAAKFAENQ